MPRSEQAPCSSRSRGLAPTHAVAASSLANCLAAASERRFLTACHDSSSKSTVQLSSSRSLVAETYVQPMRDSSSEAAPNGPASFAHFLGALLAPSPSTSAHPATSLPIGNA